MGESRSFPNWYPLSRNCCPNTFRMGHPMWQAEHGRPYFRANAGMACPGWLLMMTNDKRGRARAKSDRRNGTTEVDGLHFTSGTCIRSPVWACFAFVDVI